MAEAFEFSFKSLSERKEKFTLVKEALSERSYFVENAYYMNKFIPIVIPCENVFTTLYYYAGVIFFNKRWLYIMQFLKSLKINNRI